MPFGEYVPFRNLLPITKITAGSDRSCAGGGPQTIELPGLAAFRPARFATRRSFRRGRRRAARPAWILNVTNDAWYGRSSGPYQHFAIARTRAIEEGLPLVRVANNGISAVVDPLGRVLARTDLDAIGYVDTALPGRRLADASTPPR